MTGGARLGSGTTKRKREQSSSVADGSDEMELGQFIVTEDCPRCGKQFSSGHRAHLQKCKKARKPKAAPKPKTAPKPKAAPKPKTAPKTKTAPKHKAAPKPKTTPRPKAAPKPKATPKGTAAGSKRTATKQRRTSAGPSPTIPCQRNAKPTRKGFGRAASKKVVCYNEESSSDDADY